MILAVAFSSVINIAAGVLILVCDSSHLPFSRFSGTHRREVFVSRSVCLGWGVSRVQPVARQVVQRGKLSFGGIPKPQTLI